MKLIIQIPCFNEVSTLASVIRDLPLSIDGVETIETLVIDDGSTDGTANLARELGVDHVLRNLKNLGLAKSFRRGLEFSLAAGADIVVNTDGDNQYFGGDIARLVEPIIQGRAEFVIGDRQTQTIDHFSRSKKALQRFGSFVVRKFSGIDVPDAVSGFRAISRSAAMQINIVSSFSYTIETLIQFGLKGIAFESVPIRTNDKTRDSRLFRSIFHFVERSGTTLVRMYAMYRPLKVFTLIGLVLLTIGIVPFARFLYFYIFLNGHGKVQSLVVGSAILTASVITLVIGLLADLLARNRQLLEMTLERVRHMDYRLESLHSRSENPAIHNKLGDG